MIVQEVCTRGVQSCAKDQSLAEAGKIMWDSECGVLPIVDDAGIVTGIITDHDLCMAVVLSGQPAAELPVRMVLQPTVPTCRLSDGVREALGTMRTHKVPHLPVVDGAGVLRGMLFLKDVALASKPDRVAGPTDVTFEDIALAMKTLGRSRLPLEIRIPAGAFTSFA